MAFTYDLNTAAGKIRLNIGDTVQATEIFTDEEIAAFLSMAGGDIQRASGFALMGIASTKALLAKKKSAGNYSEDLTMLAKELRDQAKAFIEISADEPAEDVAEQIWTDFNYNQILQNAATRGYEK